MNTVTLATELGLVTSYHTLFDPILSSSIGRVIVNICTTGAVLLGVAFIAAAFCKAVQRCPSFANALCGGAMRIVLVLFLIAFLATPGILLPGLMGLLEWASSQVGDTVSNILEL